jgi:hypothetical protein
MRVAARILIGCVFCLPLLLLLSPPTGAHPAFKLAPAVAIEAEDFKVESGWKVIRNGQGNYMVDIIGFNHISGERLLGIDSKNSTASAFADITVPETGSYRLWVRYEYPAFCETRFRVVVQQNGRDVLDLIMGKKDSSRQAFGELLPRAQHDPAWGPEGVMEESVTIGALKKGPARIYLKGTTQPQTPGVSANRNIDLVYLTRDTTDAWLKHYRTRTNLYPILDAFRDTRGPRYEVRFTNRAAKPADYHITHVYNRIPWGTSEGAEVRGIAPGKSSGWVGLRSQDTAHFSLVRFTSSAGAFELEVRPLGGAVERTLKGESPLQVYLPPYPGKGDKATTPIEAIDAILAELKRVPAIGKKPTKPLCYGGWMPLGLDNDYGRKYAELYAALGFRSLHPAHSGPQQVKNLQAAGVAPTKSWMVMGYRNPPIRVNIERARTELARNDMQKYLLWYDYGDEIAFSEWLAMLAQEEVARAKAGGVPVTAAQVMAQRWVQWLKTNRPKEKPTDYWLEKWGPFNSARMRPDSSAEAAASKPRLYVDSVLFYEDEAIRFAAAGARAVRETLGADVLCGANYSCHPFYYPHSTMYIKWFRAGAGELGRHSEYFWQVAQAGPMINGYIAEHFRCGMRGNPRAVLRQYTMPHSPGNTEASFLRSAFTHLAHGATMLDFFGIGLNETFTENHIDHRDRARFRALRDVTHAIGLVEDLLPESRAVPSPVALLISESTERWDFAGIATDSAGHAYFGPHFRKTRLNAHMERLGLWTALTFLGSSPDLIIEEDVNARILKNYKVLVLVGDSLPADLTAPLEAWVRAGGVVLATANTGRYDTYRAAHKGMPALLGLDSRTSEERSTFFRPRQELPFLKPLGTLVGDDWEMPQLATYERIKPIKDVKVLARFKDDKSPGVIERRLGKGRIFYVAGLPGVAYLWSALQPPIVPDRGPATHSVPTNFDKGARALLEAVLRSAEVKPAIVASPERIDARLLRSAKGYVLPVANYHDKVGQKVTLTVRVGVPIKKVTSAYHGVLPAKNGKDSVVITIPALGYGDVLRLDP